MAELTQLVYASEAKFEPTTEGTVEPTVARILAQSRRNNARAGIGGVLFYGDSRFFQCLEGPERAVEALYQKIRRDPRHTNVRVLLRQPAATARFRDWSMKYVPAEADIRDFLRRHGFERFEPDRFTAGMVAEMIDLLQGLRDPTRTTDSMQQVSAPTVVDTARRSERLAKAALGMALAALAVACLALFVSLGSL